MNFLGVGKPFPLKRETCKAYVNFYNPITERAKSLKNTRWINKGRAVGVRSSAIKTFYPSLVTLRMCPIKVDLSFGRRPLPTHDRAALLSSYEKAIQKEFLKIKRNRKSKSIILQRIGLKRD